MLINGLEVPDSAMEAALKAAGKRVVEEDDYIKKAEASKDLAKFRAVTGESRSIEDIEKIIKAHEENDKKNKTQVELLTAEVRRLQELALAKDGEVKKAQKEVRKRDVDRYFNEAMVANKLTIIEPILAPFKQEFYDVDETGITPEILKKKVEEALVRAGELQKGELARLGLQGIPSDQASSFGGGQVNITPSKGVNITNPNVLWDMLGKTSASPSGSPLFKE